MPSSLCSLARPDERLQPFIGSFLLYHNRPIRETAKFGDESTSNFLPDCVSSILDLLSSIFYPRSSILDLLSSILDPRSSILDLRSSIVDLLSSIFYRRSSIVDLLSSIFYPRSSILDPQSSVLRFAMLSTTVSSSTSSKGLAT
jgi:hypothetical protein